MSGWQPIIEAELNKIGMNILGDRVMISALLDLKGLRLLKRKIAGLEAIMAQDSEESERDDQEHD